MLIKHSALYLSGRIVPGAVGLFALALYTRLMDTGQYGQYALVIGAMGVVNAACFQWLSLSLDRLFPAQARHPQALLSTTFAGFLIVVAITGVFGAALAWLWPDKTQRSFIVLAVIVAWAQAWYDLNLRLASARLAPIRYGLLSSVKAVLALGAGVLLFGLGLGVVGVVLGLVMGLVLVPLFASKYWQIVTVRYYDAALFKDLVHYGGPLALTILLTSILDVSDRFLLGWFLNAKAAGAYAAAYDLTQQSLGTLIGVVHLAGFPLVVRALETTDLAAARNQLRQNSFVLLAVALPATIGTILLADNVAYSLLGAEFRTDAAKLIPLVATAAFVWGTKVYYLDYAFQLMRRTRVQLWPVAVAAGTNIALNCLWIPRFALFGAAFATLAATVAGVASTCYLGRRIFTYPAVHKEMYKIVMAALGMGGVLLFASEWRGIWALLLQIAIGISVNTFLLVALDTAGARAKMRDWTLRRGAR